MTLRRLPLLVFVVALSAPTLARAQQALVVIRHAERLDATQNSPLSAAGLERAKVLASILRDLGVKAVYATQWQRTQQTVRPLADLLGVEVSVSKSDDVKDLIGQLKGKHANDIVVVAAHSDTVPEILAAYGYARGLTIGHDEYDNLFVVVPKGAGPATVLRLRY